MKSFFSKLSQGLMLPIALLPAAGIMLGIGGSFTNEQMIKAYGITFLQEGTILNSFLAVMKAAGDIVFGNLPLLFALAIAVAFAKSEKGAAALAAAIAFLIMNVSISKSLDVFGLLGTAEGSNELMIKLFGTTYKGLLTNTLGVSNTLNMGVFGGLIAGGITVILHNKYHDIELPDFLGFFAGARFVPIVSAFSALFYGMALVFIWPFIGAGFGKIGTSLGALSASGKGYIASLVFGIIERSLIPLGLHHVFYMPLWQSEIGGVAHIAGKMIGGSQNIFFASLATGDYSQFSSTNFMTGKFPFMMFGLPAAAGAMYSVADKENKKAAGGMLFSVAFTAFLTGITEPIEFTFLFLSAPLYYFIHVPLAGISFMLMDLFNVKVGMTFSGGFIDFLLFGMMPALTTGVKNNWYMILVVGAVYAPLYFFLFRWYILKHDVSTPGRNGSAVATVSKKEYREAKAAGGNDGITDEIIEALGGADNIVDVAACITRLRVTVKDADMVKDNDYWTTKLGASGLVKQGTGIQAIYGAKAAAHKKAISQKIGK